MILVVIGLNGGCFDWEGDLILVLIMFRGYLSVKDIQFKVWWFYVCDNVLLVLENGVVSFFSDYCLDLFKDIQLLFDKVVLKFVDFSINLFQGKLLVKFVSFDVVVIILDLVKQEVVFGEVCSQGLEVWGVCEKDGQFDWQKLFVDFILLLCKVFVFKLVENIDFVVVLIDVVKIISELVIDGVVKVVVIVLGEVSKDRLVEKDVSVVEMERVMDDKEFVKVVEGVVDKVVK